MDTVPGLRDSDSRLFDPSIGNLVPMNGLFNEVS